MPQDVLQKLLKDHVIQQTRLRLEDEMIDPNALLVSQLSGKPQLQVSANSATDCHVLNIDRQTDRQTDKQTTAS